jgi:hypothetical protein
LTQEEIAKKQIRTQRLEGQARARALEAAAAERYRSKVTRTEARVLAQQCALGARQLTEQQREAMHQQAIEMRKRAEADQLEARELCEEEARELAGRARALAERTEIDRRQQQGEK